MQSCVAHNLKEIQIIDFFPLWDKFSPYWNGENKKKTGQAGLFKSYIFKY